MAGADQHWNPEGRDPLDEGHLALPLVGSWIPVRVVEKGFTKSTDTGLRPQRELGRTLLRRPGPLSRRAAHG